MIVYTQLGEKQLGYTRQSSDQLGDRVV